MGKLVSVTAIPIVFVFQEEFFCVCALIDYGGLSVYFTLGLNGSQFSKPKCAWPC